MRVLFIQHDPGAGPGLIGAALRRRGGDTVCLPMSTTVADGRWEGRFPDPATFDLIVPLGAIWSVYDRSQVGSWIDAEIDLLRAADAAGVPVLGICFGAQALAAAHGGRVEASPVPEIGWTMVDSRDHGIVPPGPWMQWHHDRFSVPEGASELARNDAGPQAFLLRRNLALQFHPEVDAQIIAEWVRLGGPQAHTTLAAAGSDLDTVLADARRHRPRVERDIEHLLDAVLADT